MSKAYLKNYRQAPRKVRLVADLVRGVSVPEALRRLRFVNKRAAEPMVKLIQSAVANARSQGEEVDRFWVDVQVDEGPTLKRMRPRAQGRAFMIRKRTSHVRVNLTAKDQPEAAEEETARQT